MDLIVCCYLAIEFYHPIARTGSSSNPNNTKWKYRHSFIISESITDLITKLIKLGAEWLKVCIRISLAMSAECHKDKYTSNKQKSQLIYIPFKGIILLQKFISWPKTLKNVKVTRFFFCKILHLLHTWRETPEILNYSTASTAFYLILQTNVLLHVLPLRNHDIHHSLYELVFFTLYNLTYLHETIWQHEEFSNRRERKRCGKSGIILNNLENSFQIRIFFFQGLVSYHLLVLTAEHQWQEKIKSYHLELFIQSNNKS